MVYKIDKNVETIQASVPIRPDVLSNWRGLRVIIKGKSTDHANARDVVLGDARGRVQRGIAHIAAAVVYPTALRRTPDSELLNRLEQAVLAYSIISESEDTA